MKHVILSCMVFSLWISCVGHALAQRPQLSMDVRKKMDTDTEQSLSRYSTTKEQEKTMALTIQIRNNDPKEHAVTLSWYFIGNPLLSGFDNFVYDKGELPLTLGARTSTNVSQVSKSIGSKTSYSRTSSKKEGARPLGYIVTLMQETNLIAVATSPSTLERTVRDAAAFQKLLAVPPPAESTK